MENKLFLCLDQGGSSSRAIIYNDSGQLLIKKQRLVAEFRSDDGLRVEQSPVELAGSLQRCAEDAFAELTSLERACNIEVALISQRSSFVCVNTGSKEPVSPIVSWQDTRGREYVPASDSRRLHIYRLTGLMPNPHYSATKMQWYLQQEPAISALAGQGELKCLPLISFLLQQITGNDSYVVDRGSAARTLLLDAEKGEWSEELLEQFAISANYLPSLVNNYNNFGYLSIAGRQLPIKLIMGDQNAAYYAEGAPREDSVSINVGTGAFLLTPMAEQRVANGLLKTMLRWQDKPYYALEATINGASSAITGMAKALAIDEPIAVLEQQFANNTEPPLWINTWSGLASPYWRYDIASKFIDAEHSSVEQKLMAVCESVMFLIAVNYLQMKAVKPKLNRVMIGGGLSQLKGFCESLSSVLGCEVARPQVAESSSKGAAFLLSGRGKLWRKAPCDVFLPDNHAAVQRRFQRWHQHLQQYLV